MLRIINILLINDIILHEYEYYIRIKISFT